jgi:hypothetical protein
LVTAWLPDPSRIVPLFSYALEAPRDLYATPLPRRWPTKDTADVLDYGLDCSAYLASDDSIASVALAIEPPDLQAISTAHQGGLVLAWLSGGSAGGSYTATWTITLASGQVITADVATAVTASPALPVPPQPFLAVRPDRTAALQARSGAAIAQSNGELSATVSGVLT